MPKKKHQPPARIKYDKTHPVISIRVDKYVKGKLDEIKQMSGKSVGDVVREAIDVQAESAKNLITWDLPKPRIPMESGTDAQSAED